MENSNTEETEWHIFVTILCSNAPIFPPTETNSFFVSHYFRSIYPSKFARIACQSLILACDEHLCDVFYVFNNRAINAPKFGSESDGDDVNGRKDYEK